MTNKTTCLHCGVGNGQPHVNGCDLERWSICGYQRISCDCEEHDAQASAWNGELPHFTKLTDEQIERQDFVDGAIHALLEELSGKELSWNIELVGPIRDTIAALFKEGEVMSERGFYPFVEEAY